MISAAPEPPALDEEAKAAIMKDHIQYQLRLQADGRSLAAGGFGAAEDPDARGMTLLVTGDTDEANAIAEADPAVAGGLFAVEVRPWYIPAKDWCAQVPAE
jgi:uncharacterized protein YciI